MIRHFLRVDGNCGVGRPGAELTFVETGQTLHLDTSKEDEAHIAEDLDGARGWVEVDDSGHPVAARAERTSRALLATPTVTEVVDPLTTALVPEPDDDEEEPYDDLDPEV